MSDGDDQPGIGAQILFACVVIAALLVILLLVYGLIYRAGP